MSGQWLQVTAAVDGAREQEAANLLEELGALAVTSVGSDAEIWLERGVSDLPEWQHVDVTGLFCAEADIDSICLATKQRLDVDVSIDNLADQDWLAQSRQQMKAIKVGRNLWIHPRETTRSNTGATIIKLDPGLAFGSGSHPTTGMCLEWLSRVPRAAGTVLDYGCGSGVLSIAALLLGFEKAVAVDIDNQAIRATVENATRNGVEKNIFVQQPSELASDFTADVVIANILAGTIETLSAELMGRVRPGGWLVLSGILNEQADALCEKSFGHCQFVRWQRQQWVLLSTCM